MLTTFSNVHSLTLLFNSDRWIGRKGPAQPKGLGHRRTQKLQTLSKCVRAELSLPVRMETLAGKQAVHLLSEGLSDQFEASFQQHLELVQSSQPPAEPPAAHSSGDSGMDVLTQRIAALQAAEARRATEEMLYLRCVKQLLAVNVQLLQTVDVLQPRIDGMDLPPRLITAAAARLLVAPLVAEEVLEMVDTTFGVSAAGADTANLVSIVDRTQAAQLYAGHAEYGYFVSGMTAGAQAAGHSGSVDAAGLMAFAATMSREEMTAMARFKSLETWFAVVRHTGALFGLQQPPEGVSPSGIPYPQLQHSISSAQLAPSATLTEHYSQPGASEAAAAASAFKASKGWSSAEVPAGQGLPEPDLVAIRLDVLKRVLLEAAVLGGLLYEVEVAAEMGGCVLSARSGD